MGGERAHLAHRVAQRVNWGSFLAPSLAGVVEAALRDGYDGWQKMQDTLPTQQALQVHRVIMEVRCTLLSHSKQIRCTIVPNRVRNFVANKPPAPSKGLSRIGKTCTTYERSASLMHPSLHVGPIPVCLGILDSSRPRWTQTAHPPIFNLSLFVSVHLHLRTAI